MVLVTSNGEPACTKCGRRPKRWSGGRWQSYCRVCQTEYQRRLRHRTFAMQLTSEERNVVLAMKASPEICDLITELITAPQGRHRAAS